jgi:hypothetical protein
MNEGWKSFGLFYNTVGISDYIVLMAGLGNNELERKVKDR